jgi:hypothetical protein
MWYKKVLEDNKNNGIFVILCYHSIMKSKKIKLFPEPEFLPAKKKRTEFTILYKDEFVRLVYFFTLLGATDEQIAQALQVSIGAIETWKIKKPEFLESMRRGKLLADSKVAHSLYKSAIGYKYVDTVVLTNRVKEYNKMGKVVKEWTEPLLVKVVKKSAPNVTAAIKWLSARQPAMWGDKIQVDNLFSISHQLDLSKFSTEELQVIHKLGIGNRGMEVENALCEDVSANGD